MRDYAALLADFHPEDLPDWDNINMPETDEDDIQEDCGNFAELNFD